MAKKTKPYKPTFVDKFEELPASIQSVTNKLLQKSLQEFVKQAEFTIAFVNDIEKCLAERADHYKSLPDNTQYNIIGNVIPKYHLSYLFKRSEDQLDYYNFCIKFDEYGQVLKYGLPKDYYSTIIPLFGKEKAIQLAVEYSMHKDYKSENIEESRLYCENNVLLWDIYLLQTKERKRSSIKYCKAVTVDVSTRSVVQDCDAQISRSGNSQMSVKTIEVDENDLAGLSQIDE
ncbi:hypothetical protein [Niabella ginsengisoli]|uniref:Uncharacterized protein n=1 Tax=Niabella ginsengisoli TaxID=522298 RepID=A0ABS9SG18_9BACT|nr:hypothetical protein [Niabella ginsengisoli]MCH5597261.1 hypothetical protein [Niabella ginsengisoli]